MNTLHIILALIFSIGLSAQYETYQIGTHAGYAISLEEENFGSSFSLDLQKHLTKGIYGLVHLGKGHFTKGQNYDSERLSSINNFLADNMRQYSLVGVGIRKSLLLTQKDQMSLSFTGLTVKQNVVEWAIGEDADGQVNLYDSQERYGQRRDFTYMVALDYTHNFTDYFSLGFYGSYHAKPNFVNIGLRSIVHINSKKENQTLEKPSQNFNRKNAMEIRFNRLGGDGTEPVMQYDIEYSRQLTKLVAIYGRFSTGQRNKSRLRTDLQTLSTEDLNTYNDLFLSESNDAGTIWISPTHSTSYAAGLKMGINKDGQSKLYIAAGVVHYRADVVDVSSEGSFIGAYHEDFFQYKNWLPEFSFYYDYNFNENYYLGMKASGALIRFNISVGVHGGVRF